MKGLGRISTAIGAAVAGVAAAVFLHPRSGARHRSAAAGVARRQSATVATMVGASVARAPRRTSRGATEVADRVRAALAEQHPGADAIQLTVHKGTVTLRGEVDHLDDIDALEETARSVAGVTDVNNLLRLPTAASAGR
ncbi:MAG TPA: BON domain-containing protein [Candidatus Dormibacteraeota bacterium]|nr:BON domain-containing protein [Candidatus Dormibacteraeota bacterium]